MVSAVGISTVDIILLMDGFHEEEGSYYCERMITEGGGMAATSVATASRLGSKTRLLSRIGNDVNGSFIVDKLKEYGVDLSGVVKIPGRNSTVGIVFVDRKTGEKQFFSEYEKSSYIDFLEIDTDILEGTDVLLVDGHWMNQAEKCALWAKERCIPVVGDFKSMYTGLEKVLPLVNYLIIPSFFAQEITGEHDMLPALKNLHTRFGCIPVVTEGDKGGAYLFRDEMLRYPSFPIHCLDSTGAGDAFHGAFCHFLSKGAEIGRCLELSSAVGALNCREFGGRAALPSCEELSVFLENNGCDPIIY
ncbi:MAG: PfkB family carbohydrate kinase [Candidatus Latescibacterota bacterium]